MVDAKQRLLAKVLKASDGCWLWTGYINPAGYGKFSFNREAQLAHRVSYVLFVGKIPRTMQLDHLCRVRHCVNPEHLEVVDCRTNLLRGETVTARNAAKTHCPRGHEYSEQNTRIGKTGQRFCIECARIHDRLRIRPESYRIYKHEWYLRRKAMGLA